LQNFIVLGPDSHQQLLYALEWRQNIVGNHVGHQRDRFVLFPQQQILSERRNVKELEEPAVLASVDQFLNFQLRANVALALYFSVLAIQLGVICLE
jgi:hypothetical protein